MNQKRPVTDVLFVLILFLTFTLSALTVVLLGARAYESTQQGMDDNYTVRTALAYVSEKIRQADSQNAISLTKISQIPALALSSSAEEKNYMTYLYYYEGFLRELLIEKSRDFTLEQGSPIAALSSFVIESLPGGFYRLTASSETGSSLSLLIRPKSS
jgi:hypothetical protein